VEDLALEIGEIDGIAIHQPHASDARGGEVKGDGRAEAAGADAEHAGSLEPFLSFERHFGHDEMARIARDFVVAEFNALEAARIDDAGGHGKRGETIAAARGWGNRGMSHK